MTTLMKKRGWLMSVAFLFLSGESLADASLNFWESDIWKEADRGFLFYGPFEKKDKGEHASVTLIPNGISVIVKE